SRRKATGKALPTAHATMTPNRTRTEETSMTTPDLDDRLNLPAYPRAAKYDPAWQTGTMMGPNCLWRTEGIAERIDLRPGLRALDLVCGMVTYSIFLTKEFGVQVDATDLWIPAADTLARIRDAGVEDRVIPIHAE